MATSNPVTGTVTVPLDADAQPVGQQLHSHCGSGTTTDTTPIAATVGSNDASGYTLMEDLIQQSTGPYANDYGFYPDCLPGQRDLRFRCHRDYA